MLIGWMKVRTLFVNRYSPFIVRVEFYNLLLPFLERLGLAAYRNHRVSPLFRPGNRFGNSSSRKGKNWSKRNHAPCLLWPPMMKEVIRCPKTEVLINTRQGLPSCRYRCWLGLMGWLHRKRDEREKVAWWPLHVD